jgi:hypothetical protein
MQKISLSVIQNNKTGLFQKELPTVAAGGPMDEMLSLMMPVAGAVGGTERVISDAYGTTGVVDAVSDVVGRAARAYLGAVGGAMTGAVEGFTGEDNKG